MKVNIEMELFLAKLRKQGIASLVISVPKEVVTKYNFKEGDILRFGVVLEPKTIIKKEQPMGLYHNGLPYHQRLALRRFYNKPEIIKDMLK